jgi:hypothetical protein
MAELRTHRFDPDPRFQLDPAVAARADQARKFLKRTRDYLALCSKSPEAALEAEDPAYLAGALDAIRRGKAPEPPAAPATPMQPAAAARTAVAHIVERRASA